MSNFDVFGMCLRNLIKRKLRTFLTMLGVIIGTAALVMTISLGLASDARFARIMAEWEGDLTTITLWSSGGWVMNEEGEWVLPDFIRELDDYAIADFERIDGVVVASPLMRGQLFLRSGPYTMSAWNVTGVRPAALALMGLDVAEGRLLEDSDQYAAVFGGLAERNFARQGEWSNRLWDEQMGLEVATYVDVFNDPIQFAYDSRFIWGMTMDDDMDFDDSNDALRPIRSFPLDVVGLLEPTGETWGIDSNIYMDIATLQSLELRRMDAQREQEEEWGRFSAVRSTLRLTYDEVFIRVASTDDTARVASEIRDMGFHSMFYPGADIHRQQDQQQGIMNMLIAIAAASIFVAAISIANTMVMAVYERTREIGIMKVIGGSIRDIRRMFLLEAALIGFFGGILGVGLSLLGSYAMNNVELEALRNMGFGTGPDAVSLITPWLCGVALLFASAIGLVSGYFPARRATKLSALTAMSTQ